MRKPTSSYPSSEESRGSPEPAPSRIGILSSISYLDARLSQPGSQLVVGCQVFKKQLSEKECQENPWLIIFVDSQRANSDWSWMLSRCQDDANKCEPGEIRMMNWFLGIRRKDAQDTASQALHPAGAGWACECLVWLLSIRAHIRYPAVSTPLLQEIMALWKTTKENFCLTYLPS